MQTEKKETEQSDDVVKREDYNKVVESFNSLKAEKEQLDKKMKESELNKEKEAQKAEWLKEKEEIQKQMEELKKNLVEKKEDIKVSKSVVNEQKQDETPADFHKLLDEQFPTKAKKPEEFGSAISRYAYYKNPATKAFSHQQLGRGMSLHATAQRVSPDIVPQTAYGKTDIIIKKQI